MTRSNLTIAEHMRAVLLEAGRSVITRDDVDLLNECACRCVHTTLVEVEQQERHRRIFMALDFSPYFFKTVVQRPGRGRYRSSKFHLLEAVLGGD